MNRRRFLLLAGAAALKTKHAHAQTAPVAITMPSARGPVMPQDFTGLSYEAGQLYNADYFSPSNAALIATFKGLSEHGVLRMGGHLSNITVWEGVGQDDPKQLRGVQHGIDDYWEWPLVDPTVQRNRKGMITHRAIENLRGFLDAVNWRLIYGLNFACGSAARAADEAVFVSQVMGDRLIAFVIGNEPDGFAQDQFFRPKSYNFDQYIAEYDEWVRTVRAKTPHARFAGPDTEGKVETWVKGFARHEKRDAVLLTSHFYGMGPASDPHMTAERLLRKVNPDLEAQIAGVHETSALSGGVPYRMDEGNSCFGGGRPGVSDAYASALWAADYMLRAASEGFAGVNLHGGGVGIYTPIETSEKSAAAPRPVYYGMQFAQRFAGFAVSRCTLRTNANVAVYVGKRSANELLIAVVNKGAEAIHIQLPGALRRKPLQVWRLSGPALDAKDGVHFEEVSPSTGEDQIVEGYSAVLWELGSPVFPRKMSM
jgi:hypothetical protein